MEQNLLEKHKEQHIEEPKAKTQGWHWAYFVWGGIAVVVIGGLIAAPLVYLSQYATSDSVFPGVYIGEHHVGGLSRTALQRYVESKDTDLVEHGFTFSFADEEGRRRETEILPIVNVGVLGQSFSYASIDVEATVAKAMAVGRQGSVVERTLDAIGARFVPRKINAEVDVLDQEFADVLDINLGKYEIPMQNAGLSFASSTPTITPEKPGEEFDYGAAIAVATANLQHLEFKTVEVPRVALQPSVTAREAQPLLEKFAELTPYFPFTLYYVPPVGQEKSWSVTFADLEPMLGFQKAADGEVYYGVEREPFEAWLEPIAAAVEVLPQEAKFSLGENGNKAVLFQPSRNGIRIDEEKQFWSVNKHFELVTQGLVHATTTDAYLVYEVAEPKIKTADVNEFGITERLSTGVSKFIGSSADRIKNIQNASDKLNGVLIPPGEEFSLVSILRPITRENGYVPEFVIKGDKIEKDIGGGLCQIGTTAFRMAMNAGMKITERRNHSLVVSYYNDLTNGNPGTDATIFDPVLDFKFVNTTDHYLLMTTEVDVPNKELRYHLWGASDGRKGYYTPPVVHRWIPTGPAKEIKTTDRSPGTRYCQSAHPGAVTSFTYYIEHPDGTVDERVFESHYRPLPQICFIGVTEEELAADQAAEAEGDSESVENPQQQDNETPTGDLADGFKEGDNSEETVEIQ